MRSHTRPSTIARLRALTLALALLLAPLLGLTATPALAAPSCTTSGQTTTCTFSYTGAPETWTVPADVTQATFTLVGAPGGVGGSPFGSYKAPGGRGARVQATLSLTPLTTVSVVVGGPGGGGGSEQGGFNGGGSGNFSGGIPTISAGGGGATDIRIGGTDLAHRVIVAGGGGGGGGNGLRGDRRIDLDNIPGGAGGDATLKGSNGTAFSTTGGGQGGASGDTGGQGGAAGTSTPSDRGTPGGDGTLGVGGSAGTGNFQGGDGGGGGGGYVGGGGGGGGSDYFDGSTGNFNGSGGGGGGGGSNLVPAGGTAEVDTSGVPQVVIVYTVLSDTTAPTASPTQAPAANSAGWNKSDVTVSWNWSDSGTGIDTTKCTNTSASSGEGTLALTASCTDLANNTGSASYTVKVDKSAPTISAAATSAPNAAGWYNAPVTVHFTCADTLSGIPQGACPADQVLSSDGAAVSSTAQSVSDAAGNSATSNVVTVKIDRTAPTLAPAVSPNPIILGGSATVSAGAADALSGLASQSCGTLDTSSVGAKSVSCTASDNAGNSASVSASYQVIYAWSGFFQPVDNLPTLNSVKAGQAIPVKFSLGSDQGLSIFASGYPKSQQITCSSGAPIDDVEQTVTAGNSSLQYDATTGQYSYTWKTEKGWAGTCRQLVVKLIDGTEHMANFKFK